MHIEFHLEEPSAEAALKNIVPRILKAGITANYRVYRGKRDLLRNLPKRLLGYSRSSLPKNWRIVVLIDEDRRPCAELKKELEAASRKAGLSTKSGVGRGSVFQVLNRIAIEELEAWFFGDVDALAKAYPGVSPNLKHRQNYRDPDAIKGGTWEMLEKVLQRAGYYRSGLRKIEAARTISQHMDPRRNRSRSFQVFRDGLLAL